MDIEKYKDIIGYEGVYQVSNFGNVKSLSRVLQNQGKNNFLSKEKILKKVIASNGKYIVRLYLNKKGVNFQVHQLVAIAFLNHKPEKSNLIVDHIDNNPLNNNLLNLQLISQRENCSKDKKNYTSNYVGVSFIKSNKKWMACIQIDGKNKNLGSFVLEIDAHLAYKNKLQETLCLT